MPPVIDEGAGQFPMRTTISLRTEEAESGDGSTAFDRVPARRSGRSAGRAQSK